MSDIQKLAQIWNVSPAAAIDRVTRLADAGLCIVPIKPTEAMLADADDDLPAADNWSTMVKTGRLSP